MGGNTITYVADTSAVGIKWITKPNDYFGGQSADKIQAKLPELFGASSSPLPNLVGQIDSGTGNNDSKTNFGTTFTNPTSFQYLSVHFGSNSLVFDFGSTVGTNDFKLKGLPNGFSNYRAFGTIAAPVPEPEEYAMMLLGFGMVGYQIKRKQKQMAQAAI